jgi:hypothetical protein
MAWKADRAQRDLNAARADLAKKASEASAKKREADIFAEPQGTKEQIIDRL